MPNLGWPGSAGRDLPGAGSVSHCRRGRRRARVDSFSQGRGVTALAAEHAARRVDPVVVAELGLGAVGSTLQLSEWAVRVAGLLRRDHWKSNRGGEKKKKR